MRVSRFCLLPALVLVPASLVAQAQAPILTFEKLHHDFGKIGPDRKVAHRFKATNTGTATLNITNLNASCGCTATALGKWSLNPGESTEIEATFDPKGMKNLVRKSIQVTSNDAKAAIQTLTFEAEVVQEINMESSAIFFLEVPRTLAKRSTLRLKSGNGQQVQVTEIKAPGAPYLAGAVTPDGKDAVLELTFDPKAVPAGIQRGVDKVTLRTTSTNQPSLTVDVQWNIKAVIASTPDRIVLREASGKELRATVTLKHAEGKVFTVTGAKPTSNLLKVMGLGKKAAAQELTIVLAASAKAGTYNERIEFTTDDPEQPVVEVRIVALLS
jgi:hypothetical protein